MDATRAGKGCCSCKSLVKQIVEWAADGDLTEDPAASSYVPGIPMAKPELMAAIREQDLRSVSAVFAALAPGGKEDAKSKMGLTSLLKMLWGVDFVPEKDGEFINDRVHANIQRDGTFSVVPQMKGGVTTPAQLRRIAEVAEKYEVPMVEITGGQRIDLLGVRKEDLPAMWNDLGMPSGYAYGKSFRTVKTCAGSDFCRFGLGDSTQLGIDLETRFQGIESPAKMSSPSSAARATAPRPTSRTSASSGHLPGELHTGMPELFSTARQVAAALDPDACDVVVCEDRPRTASGPAGRELPVADTVLRVRRRTQAVRARERSPWPRAGRRTPGCRRPAPSPGRPRPRRGQRRPDPGR